MLTECYGHMGVEDMMQTLNMMKFVYGLAEANTVCWYVHVLT